MGEGNEAYKNQNYSEAIALYSKAIAADPENPVYYGNRAAAYMMVDKFGDALKDCENATRLDPSFVRAHLRMAKCYTELGRFLEAKIAYSKVLEFEPHNKAAATEMKNVDLIREFVETAKQSIENNDAKRALQYLDRASNLTSTKKIELLRAEAILGLKEYDRAVQVATSILQRDDTNPDALYVRGFGMYRLGNHAQALAHMKRLIAYNPDDSRAIKLLKLIRRVESVKEEANEAFKAGRYEEAVKLYEQGTQCDPENDKFNATLYCNMAAALMKQGNYKDAILACTKAIDRDDKYVKAYKRRATCYTQENEHDDAVRDLQQVLEMEPDQETDQELRRAKKRAKVARRKDYYKILNVSRSATEPQIKTAYRKAALKWHPDRWSGKDQAEQDNAEKQFKDVGEAFAVLSDPQKKQRYDNGESLEDMQGGGGMNSADINDIFSMFFGGGGGGMGGMGGMGGHGHSRGGFHSHGGGFPRGSP